MALISTKVHGVLDYAGGVGSLAAPKLLRDRRAAAILAGTGATTLAASALTDYELGIRRRLPMPIHLLADAATGALLIGGAMTLRRRGAKILDWGPLVVVGASELAGAALTDRHPGDRTGTNSGHTAPGGVDTPLPGATPGISGEGLAPSTSAAGGPPLAPPPLETPGPSVSPPAAPESDTERTEREDALVPDGGDTATGDVLVAQQEAAAAAEAARIGGVVTPESGDPAMEPVYEAGGGEQDGWELTEDELIENASHGDGRANPARDALSPELEADEATAVYGEPDHARSQGED
jgi:hypothetical protein